MAGFKGSFEYSIDDKGRINLPAKLKKCVSPEALDTFTLTKGFEACIYVYPQNVWDRVEHDLEERLNQFKRDDRRFLRKYLMGAHEVTMDRQNRIIVPDKLLEYAKISKDVLIIGALDRIEFWNPEEYDKYDSELDAVSYEEIAARVMGGM
jgi:MraZ protein